MGRNQFHGAPRGGGVNQSAMKKQAQKLQKNFQQMQDELEQASYTASAGGGAVKATVSGKFELTELTIDPETVDPDDIDMLQDMIIAAVNEALRKAQDTQTQSLNRLTGGLGGMGGLSGLL